MQVKQAWCPIAKKSTIFPFGKGIKAQHTMRDCTVAAEVSKWQILGVTHVELESQAFKRWKI